MTHYVEAILTCAVILTFYAAWGLARESRTAKKAFEAIAKRLDTKMQNVTFTLYRRLKPSRRRDGVIYHKSHKPAIVSTMSETIKTNDPFAARLALQHRYPGWAVGSNFETETDREYAEIEFESYPEELDSGDE
jgi:hypothetical protein